MIITTAFNHHSQELLSHPNTSGRTRSPSCPTMQSSYSHQAIISCSSQPELPLTWHIISNSSTNPSHLAKKHKYSAVFHWEKTKTKKDPPKPPSNKPPTKTPNRNKLTYWKFWRKMAKRIETENYSCQETAWEPFSCALCKESSSNLETCSRKNRNSHHKLWLSSEFFCLCLVGYILRYI